MLKHLSFISTVVVALSLFGSHAWANITEFELPNPGSGLGGILVGPDGNLWFNEYNSNQIGRITPSGEITEFALIPGSGPHYMTIGPDANIWFAAADGNRIGRITPDGDVTQFDLPTPNSRPFA